MPRDGLYMARKESWAGTTLPSGLDMVGWGGMIVWDDCMG